MDTRRRLTGTTWQMSETFAFDVSYSTTFEQLEKLRDKMMEFVVAERRDYEPAFDVVVIGTSCSFFLVFLSCVTDIFNRFSGAGED